MYTRASVYPIMLRLYNISILATTTVTITKNLSTNAEILYSSTEARYLERLAERLDTRI